MCPKCDALIGTGRFHTGPCVERVSLVKRYRDDYVRRCAETPVPDWELAERRGYTPLPGWSARLDRNDLEGLAWWLRVSLA